MVSSSTNITITLNCIIQSRLCLKLVSYRMLLRNALTFNLTDEKLYRSHSAQSSPHWASYFQNQCLQLRSSSTRFEGCNKFISKGKAEVLSSYSPVSTEIRLGLEDPGNVVQFPTARSKPLFSNASIQAMWLTQLSIRYWPRASSQVGKAVGLRSLPLSPCSAQVNAARIYIPSSPIRHYGVVLKHRTTLHSTNILITNNSLYFDTIHSRVRSNNAWSSTFSTHDERQHTCFWN
jgi:hypothetical protein